MTEPAWYLGCRAEDVGDRAILMGDRGRVAVAAELLDDPVRLNEDRGLTTVTGGYAGRRVTVAAFGMGAPIAAAVLHELALLGVRRFLRLGTVLAVGPAALGCLALAEGAVRYESTSTTYLPLNFPAVADQELTAALRARLAHQARPSVTGLIASYDGFYTEMVAVEPSRAEQVRVRLTELAGYGVVAVDMETSAVLVAARALGVRAASLCLASVDGLTRDKLDPAERQTAERDLVRVGLAGLTDLD